MKALTLNVNRDTWSKTKGYELSEVATPELRENKIASDANAVIVEPILAGVCGTDKGIWFRKAFKESILHSLEADQHTYRIAGHEALARITAVGSAVKRAGRFHVGQLVSAESHLYCGTCPMCLTGNQHVCANEKIIGVTADGVFAERLKLPANVLWPTVVELIRPEVAAIQEPFGNAVHVCTPSGGKQTLKENELRGKTVAIFGTGTIGLFCILIARALGAKKIIGVEPNPINTDRAKACGADLMLQPSEHAAEEIKAATDGYGADYCFEMSGFASSVQQAIKGSRRGGHIVLFGLASGDLVVPAFEELITAGKSIHAVVGRRVFSTWELTQQLLEERSNGIQDQVWKIILNSGQGTILPLTEFTQQRFEKNMQDFPKTLVSIGKL
jgi:threonine 3-dehydrogenase